jgi:hypothetical protein
MKKLILWGSILVSVVLGGKALIEHMSRTANEHNATQRVEAFLAGLSQGGDFQAAFNMWVTGAESGIRNMSQDEYNMQVGRLQAWLRSQKLASPIRSYETLGAEMVTPPEGLDAAVVVVSCSIDGKRLGIRAVQGQPLEWAE